MIQKNWQELIKPSKVEFNTQPHQGDRGRRTA
jgi:hypothetical protein